MQVIILAGGAGTRLKSVTGDLPKPLVDICGTPLLGRQLEMLAASRVCHQVLVLTGYGSDQIAAYCGNGARWNLQVRCSAEVRPRGTAGAVLDAMPLLEPTFVVMYGDTMLDVDLKRLIDAHMSAAPAATLLVHPNDHPQDSDLLELNANNEVRRFLPRSRSMSGDYPNLVNAGLYVLERAALADLEDVTHPLDFGKDVFPYLVDRGHRLLGYRSPEYIKDAGTPDRLIEVRKDVESGRVSRKSLRHPTPAVFLDRDGVLNEERSYITRAQDLLLLPGVGQAIARLNRSEFRTIVVTNQPVIARGECTEEELAQIHAGLDTMLGANGSYIDRLYYCPHHPDRGFSGEVVSLKQKCNCRKPMPGMVEQAVADLNIALEQSWMVGDSTVDIELARRCGLRSILVQTGHGGRDGKFPGSPDFVAADLSAAVNIILGGSSNNRPYTLPPSALAHREEF